MEKLNLNSKNQQDKILIKFFGSKNLSEVKKNIALQISKMNIPINSYGNTISTYEKLQTMYGLKDFSLFFAYSYTNHEIRIEILDISIDEPGTFSDHFLDIINWCNKDIKNNIPNATILWGNKIE